MLFPFTDFSWLGDLALALAAGYSSVALIASIIGVRRSPASSGAPSFAVTVLKPLCGDEPRLFDNLRSFCIQAYDGPYQIVFGANTADDPALDVARQLQAQYPELDIVITSGCTANGNNRKVANLSNMLSEARHDMVVIADSDIRVEPNYLKRVVAPLTDKRVGLVTCLYNARPTRGLWSRLGAQYVNDWFAPSVMMAQRFGGRMFAFGATIALRRETLDAVGGFAAVADHLADDYRLGALVKAQGLDTVLSDYVVETTAHEPKAADLISHERRWMQTIRGVQPLSYNLTFISCALPLAVLGLILAGGETDALVATTIVLGLRMAQRLVQPAPSLLETLIGLALVPLREFLTAYAWFGGLLSRRIEWRDQQYAVARNGSVTRTTSWNKS